MNFKTDAGSLPHEPLAAALIRWRAQVDRDLKGAPFEKRLITQTIEGIALQPLYTRADLADNWNADQLPGRAPFRRGRRANAAEPSCRCLQVIHRESAQSFNTALKKALMQGLNAVVIPGGHAPEGTWSPKSVRDLEVALAGVDTGAVPVHFETSADSLAQAALLRAYAKLGRVDLHVITGSMAFDPVGASLANGALPVNWSGTMDDLAAWQKWAAEAVPLMRSIGVDVSAWNDAGANAVQELAFALATTKEILSELIERGITTEKLMKSLLVSFATGPQFFMEIAKYRAWRVLLSKLLAALDLEVQCAGSVAVHARSSRWNKTRLDHHVNLLRLTTESLAAGLGGVDGIQIDSFEASAGTGSERSERIARNLHVLLFDEFGFAQPQDAVGGSYYGETVTDQLARKAWAVFREVEARGGMRLALREGWPQAQVAETVAQRQQDFATRKNGLIGTNLFPNAKDQIAKAIRGPKTNSCFIPLGHGTRWTERLDGVSEVLAAGRAMDELLGDEYTGDQTEVIVPLPIFCAAAPFELLRQTAQVIESRRGKAPTAYLAKMGSIKEHKPRADFAAEFMAVGGFAIKGGDAPVTAVADVVVICSTDENYETLVPKLAAELKQSAPERTVLLAGLPRDPERVARYQTAGVDEFIHVKANLPEILSRLLNKLGANL